MQLWSRLVKRNLPASLYDVLGFQRVIVRYDVVSRVYETGPRRSIVRPPLPTSCAAIGTPCIPNVEYNYYITRCLLSTDDRFLGGADLRWRQQLPLPARRQRHFRWRRVGATAAARDALQRREPHVGRRLLRALLRRRPRQSHRLHHALS